MKVNNKIKLCFCLFFIACLIVVSVSSVCADESVTTFTEMNTVISNNKNISLANNINGLDGIKDGITINRNTTVDGNGHYIDAKSTGRFFQITNSNAVLTLKNITLKNGKASTGAAIIGSNYDVNLILENNIFFDNNIATSMGGAIYSKINVYITSTNGNVSFIYNNGVITSGVTFYVYGYPLTTYDSLVVDLKTVDGISIKSDSLIFSDDQEHNYKSYMYDDNNDFYDCYIPIDITGYVTFNNVVLSNYPVLVSKGSLNITEYPKKTVSNRNIFKTTPSKFMKRMFDDSEAEVMKTTPQNHTDKNIPVLTPILKKVTHNIKSTVKSLFKFSNTFLRA